MIALGVYAGAERLRPMACSRLSSADLASAFSRSVAAPGVVCPSKRSGRQEFDYRLSRILRADFDYKDIFSASAMQPPGANTMTP